MTRKDFLRGLWGRKANDEIPAPQSSPEPYPQEHDALESWPVPPELQGGWLRHEAQRLGFDPARHSEERLQRLVMHAMHNQL